MAALVPLLVALFGPAQPSDDVQAVRDLRAAYETSPDLETALGLGAALARVGRIADAVEVLEAGRALSPSAPEPYLVAALVLRDADRQREGADLLEEALARGRETRTAPVYEELGFLLLSLGALERAREVAREGLEHFPDSPRLEMILGLGLAHAGSGSGSDAAAAVRHLARALALGAPDPARLHRELGTLLVDQGETDEGIEHLRTAVTLEPTSPEARFRLGTALRAVSDLEGAEAELARFQELQRRAEALEVRERKLRTDLNEAQRFALANRLAEALAKLGATLAEHPEDPRPHVLRAKVLSSLGRDEEALSDIVAAKGLAPSSVETRLLEGRFLLKLGRFEAASNALQDAVTLAPTLVEGYELLGVVEANLERHDSAVRFFERARALGADSEGLYLNLAESLRKLGREDEAARILEARRAR